MKYQLCISAAIIGCMLSILTSDKAVAQMPDLEVCSNPRLPATTPSNAFAVLGDGGAIRHESTGLEWQRCTRGQVWDGETCTGSAEVHTWQEALGVAASIGDGWRLPNLQELRSIVERCRQDMAINRKAFPNLPSYTYWSSSPASLSASWGINFNAGLAQRVTKDSVLRVRLVRDAQ